MKVLSIREPFASLIIEGYKKYEFRSWNTNYRGRILIHSSLSYSKSDIDRFKYYNLDYKRGYIIGEATLKDCILVDEKLVEKLRSIDNVVYAKSGYKEKYAFVLEDVCKYSKPIKVKGKLGLWNYEK